MRTQIISSITSFVCLLIFLGESFGQEKIKIFVEADSLTKEKIENYLEQNKKRNQKIQYEIL
ncbi:MAG: hypothetical protein KKG06_06370, partial [Bacteroidetes bacterium]|nr:hypothetical protein [Bacteroidota bacterium]MBU1422792.1 hypothetical protein [Bacteroidota bacterium]